MVVPDIRTRKPSRGATAVATATVARVILLATALGLPSWGFYSLWSRDHAQRTHWRITGPPCPTAPADWRPAPRSRQPFDFDFKALHFSHTAGGADCSTVPQGGFFSQKVDYVCQFTDPEMLVVTTGGRTLAFEPGRGRRATVTLRRGQVTCVIGGWSNL